MRIMEADGQNIRAVFRESTIVYDLEILLLLAFVVWDPRPGSPSRRRTSLCEIRRSSFMATPTMGPE